MKTKKPILNPPRPISVGDAFRKKRNTQILPRDSKIKIYIAFIQETPNTESTVYAENGYKTIFSPSETTGTDGEDKPDMDQKTQQNGKKLKNRGRE